MKKILNIEKIIDFNKNNNELSKTFISISLFFAMAIIAPFLNVIFLFKPEISSFSSHIISNVALNDLDVSKRVNGYYFALFFILILGFSFYFILVNLFDKEYNLLKKDKFTKALFTTSLIGIFTILSGIFVVKVDIAVYFLIILNIILLINFKNKNLFIDFDLTLWSVLISIPLAEYFFIFLKKNNFYGKLPQDFLIYGVKLPVDLTLVILIFLFAIICLSFTFFVKIIFKKANENNFNQTKNVFLKSFIPVLLVPILFSIIIEFMNIVNLRINLVFNNPFILFTVFFIVAFFYAFLFFKKNIKNSIYNNQNNFLSKYYFPLIIIGFAFMITQPWRMISPENEFFETANHGLAIDHFFRYYSIPIIENYDAHMLSFQVFPYLYGFLNGYEPFAPFLYLGYFYGIEIVLVFYLFRKVLGSFTAFLISFCLPIVCVIHSEFILSGFLAVFIIQLLNNKTNKNYYWFWIISFLLCLYKLDLGFASILSGTLTLLIADYFKTSKIEWKKLILTASITGVVLLVLFSFLCLIKGINPFSRLIEFLVASASNQNWGVLKMGDMNNFIFRISYFILPILTILTIGYLIFNLFLDKSFKNEIFSNKYRYHALILFLFFAMFFIFNVPRGIVRHNFEYGNIFRIISTIPLALIMFVLLISKSNTFIKFLSVFIICFGFVNANGNVFNYRSMSLLTEGSNSANFNEKFLEAERFNGTRVRPTLDLSEAKTFKNLLDNVLKADETYFDFSSKNYYYALTERKNPCYLNQTPLMINGDKGQDFVLDQIKNSKIPIVLMPISTVAWASIDEVYVDFKFYKISEYIYANYEPILRMSSFDVYVLKNKKSNFESILKNKGFFDNKKNISDLNFLSTDKINKSNLQITSDGSGKVILTSTGENSFFSGMIDFLKNNNQIPESNGLPISLNFNLNSTTKGSIKVYYNLNQGDSYSEERMKELPINQIGTSDLSIDFEKLPTEIMVAIKAPLITLNNLTLSTGSQNTVTNPAKLDYWLRNVPRLWAEKSGESVFETIKPLSEPVTEATISVNKSVLTNTAKPYYFYIEANSDTDIGGKLELFDSEKVKASFNFEIKPGKHSYAIRMSSNYYWWQLSTNRISFVADKPVQISKFAMLSDDGKEIYNYKSGGLTLSSITDDNWSGGVGLSFNMLLFDNSPSKLKLLSSGKQLKFNDGSLATILGVSVAGSYIQVTVKEDVKKMINIASYPNSIEIIK